jgi:hypothetical protein
VCLRALGKKIDVQRTVRQEIGELELRGGADAATLPMVVDNA